MEDFTKEQAEKQIKTIKENTEKADTDLKTLLLTKPDQLEFERQYASDAGKTIIEMRAMGFIAEPCTCGEDFHCKGWVYTPTTQEAVNFNTDYENRYINKFFDGKDLYRSLKGSHYHLYGCSLTASEDYHLITLSIDNPYLNENGKTYSPDSCCRLLFEKEFCCNKWWNELGETSKMWIHYYFYDIADQEKKVLFESVGIDDLHEGMIGV